MLILAGFRRASFASDLGAGLVLAAIAIPEQIATARLAGMPAETGLYAFICGSLMFAVFGTDRFASIGADSTIATIFASGVAALTARGSAEYVATVTLVSLITGVLLVTAGAVRAGWIADLLSVPVTVGFLAGIAVHIIVGQLPLILGLTSADGSLLVRIGRLADELPRAHGVDAALGFGVVVIMLGLERLSAKLPAPFIALAAAAGIVGAFHLNEHGVATLGPLHPGAPRPPWLGDGHPASLLSILPVALIIALVCMVQTAAVLRTYGNAPDDPKDPSQDFAAVGIGSLLAAGIGAFAVDASPPRTASARASGARSQLAGVIAAALVTLVVIVGSQLTIDIPQAALGGILVCIGIRLFRGDELLRIARRGGGEIILALLSAVLVVAFSIETGMLASIVLSLLAAIYAIARPPSAVLTRVPGTTVWWPAVPGEAAASIPGLIVFAPGAPITFTNARYVVDRLKACIAAEPAGVKTVILECSGVLDIDYSGGVEIDAAIRRLRAARIDVAVARLESERAYRSALRSGLIATIGRERVFKSVYEAFEALGFGDDASRDGS